MKTKTKTETVAIPAKYARPPIVVVMGHIDHGKTSLLDHIRKTKVAEREAGGITQAIGAYQIEEHGKKITFIDTPGHETFSAMRARGAHVADIAVLVVAADEGIKPQAEEALKNIQTSELPFVIAINKIDKSNADPNRVKQELAEHSVFVEGYGGTVPAVELSAKTGAGIESLLETILLLAELEELSSDPAKPGEGVVIESHLDSRRGPSATLLVENGTVNRGEYIVIGSQSTPVRIFENFLGMPIESAGASDPIRITGFQEVPTLGDRFRIYKTRAQAETAAKDSTITQSVPNETEHEPAVAGRSIVQVILKADTRGSLEALEQAISQIHSDELGNKILKSEVGDVNESDFKLASASSSSFIIGFKVKVPAVIRDLAERAHVPIISDDIIYKILDDAREAMIALAPVEARRAEIGNVKILARFKEDKGKQIVGGKVEMGKIQQGARFDIIRNKITIGQGRAIELQQGKKQADEVLEGNEFGILADASMSIAPGDTLVVFTEEKLAPRL